MKQILTGHSLSICSIPGAELQVLSPRISFASSSTTAVIKSRPRFIGSCLLMASHIRRREFIGTLGDAAVPCSFTDVVTWPEFFELHYASERSLLATISAIPTPAFNFSRSLFLRGQLQRIMRMNTKFPFVLS